MSAEVENILPQLASIQREIIDPVSNRAIVAYDNIPYAISVADMPLFLNFAGALTANDIVGSDSEARTFNERRNYRMVLYHSSFGSGVEGEKYGLLAPYFKLVYDKFGAYPHLKNLGGVLDAKLISDGGMQTVQFAGQTYYGISFVLQIISKTRRIYGDGE